MQALRLSSLNIKRRPAKVIISLMMFVIVGLLANQQWQRERTVTYVIPPGTGAQLAAGQELASFPQEIILTIGLQDTLVIENQDDEVHAFGPFSILPHTTLTKRFKLPTVYESACTFHQDRTMRLVIKPAPWAIFQ